MNKIKQILTLILFSISTLSYSCTSKGLLSRAWLSMTSDRYFDTFTEPNFGTNPEDTDIPEDTMTYFAGDYRMDVLYLKDIHSLPDEYPNTDKTEALMTLPRLDDYTENGAIIRISFYDKDIEYYVRAYFGMRDNQKYCTTLDISRSLIDENGNIYDGVNARYNSEIRNYYYENGNIKSSVFESWSEEKKEYVKNGKATYFNLDGTIKKIEIFDNGILKKNN